MMLDFAFIMAPITVMACAFLALIHTGFLAGEMPQDRGLGLRELCTGVLLLILQAALWVIWALKIGGVI